MQKQKIERALAEDKARRAHHKQTLRERGVAELAAAVPAGSQTPALDEAAAFAAPGGFGTGGSTGGADAPLFVAGPSHTYSAVRRVQAQFPAVGRRRPLHAGLQHAFQDNGGDQQPHHNSETTDDQTSSSAHAEWKVGMLSAFDIALSEWKRKYGGSGEDMDPDELRQALLARSPALCKSRLEVEAIVKRSLFAGRLDRLAYEKVLDCGEFPWKRKDPNSGELSMKMQSAIADAWGSSMRNAFLHIDSDRSGSIDRKELEVRVNPCFFPTLMPEEVATHPPPLLVTFRTFFSVRI